MPEFKISTMPHRKSATFQQLYSNVASLGESFYDVTISFGLVAPSGGEEEKPSIEDQVSVTMAWEHAKAMCRVLSARIAAYEERHGKLRESGPQIVESAPSQESTPGE